MKLTVTKDALQALSPQYAFEKSILPLSLNGNKLELGLIDANNKKLINDIKFDTGFDVLPVELPADIILKNLKSNYPDQSNANSGQSESQNLLITDNSNVDFINQVIMGAIKTLASDIHLESLDDSFRIRYRIDGHLREVSKLNKDRNSSLISRVKIMANLDIAEKRRPQDGKIRFKFNDREIDIRVSTLPTTNGEKAVLRILDKSQLRLDMELLGLSDKQKTILLKHITAPYGMILVTGPTGSGKTTSLYAALKSIHSDEKNIMTVEDPVEYNLNGINQCNVKSDIGFNFASALRSFLRQDPDVIMVGEIRDKETAEIAIRASLTGHLVFSTLHTNDSVSAVTRLSDMGIEPFLIASSVKLIIAQRLVRKLCNCKIPANEPIPEWKINKQFLAVGCEECGYTGYRGRTALFEFAEITNEIQELISIRKSQSEIYKELKKNGFVTLQEAGREKIMVGITSYEEVLRETNL